MLNHNTTNTTMAKRDTTGTSDNRHKASHDTGKNQSIKRGIINRVFVLYFLFCIGYISVATAIIYIQTSSAAAKHNYEMLQDGLVNSTKIKARRGAILARNGEPLAISSVRYYITMDFASEGMKSVSDKTYTKLADSLSTLLAAHFDESDAPRGGHRHISKHEYFDQLMTKRNEGKERAVKIFPRSVTLDEWNMMREYPILNGELGWVCSRHEDNQRLHPSKDLALQFLGHNDSLIIQRTDGSTFATYGSSIERVFDQYLRGTDGRIHEQEIAYKFRRRIDHKDNRTPVDGCDVVTTLDADLQRAATEILRANLEEYAASFGVAVVMEAETGNILCMVNLGTGPERGKDFSEKGFNHALGTSMSPGSTMKLVSTMALMELRGFTPDTTIDLKKSEPNGTMVGGRNVADTHNPLGPDEAGDELTLEEALEHSSNVFFAKAIYENFKDNPQEYLDYLVRLRFNECIGLEEYGEKASSIPVKSWNYGGGTRVRLPGLAYGYEVSLPPIHMLTFYNGVANGGRMVAPRLVDRIERNGKVVKRMPVVTLVDRMCSETVAHNLWQCLETTSKAKRVSFAFKGMDIPFGCKTGTAQISGTFHSDALLDKEQMADNKIVKEDKYYYGSIVTIFPIDNPKYTLIVGVGKQLSDKSKHSSGITLAGYAASDIMKYMRAHDTSLLPAVAETVVPYAPTTIKAGNNDDVKAVSKRHALHYSAEQSNGEWLNATVDNGGNATVSNRNIEPLTVPDVTGMGLSDALYLLESASLKVGHTGSGAVHRQSIRGGTPIEQLPNDSIYISLR